MFAELALDDRGNLRDTLEVSRRAYVLETGTVALADDSDKLRDNPDVQKAYLGA